MLTRFGLFASLAGCVFLTDADRERRVDADGDGFNVLDDCDDAVVGVFPGAEEICDGVDQDCDGEIDDGFYPDEDGDGFGDDTHLGEACFVDWIKVGGDCEDDNALQSPGGLELCDGLNNSCAEGWTPESELGVVTWWDEDGVPVDWSEKFGGEESSVTLPSEGTLEVCRRAEDEDYGVRLVSGDAPNGLVIRGRAIPMEGDDADISGRPVFSGADLAGPILRIVGTDWSAEVSGLVFKNGQATVTEPGGDIHVSGGSLELENVLFGSGLAQEDESVGCMYLYEMLRVTVSDSAFVGCIVGAHPTVPGAAIGVVQSEFVGVYDSTFYANSSSWKGGGIGATGDSFVEVKRVEFQANEGDQGGGALFVDTDVDIELTDVTITGNTASNADEWGGAGIFCAGGCTCTTSTITGNEAGSKGGGVRVEGDNARFLGEGCTVSGNTPNEIWADEAVTPPDDTFYCNDDGCEDQ